MLKRINMRSASTRSLSLCLLSFFCLRCSDCKLHLLLMHACLCVCVLSVVCLLLFSLSIWFFGFYFLFFAAAKFFFLFVLTALPVTLIRLFCALRHCLGIRLATAAVVAVVAVAAAASADVAGSAAAIHF